MIFPPSHFDEQAMECIPALSSGAVTRLAPSRRPSHLRDGSDYGVIWFEFRSLAALLQCRSGIRRKAVLDAE
jgi:hypothetical protein